MASKRDLRRLQSTPPSQRQLAQAWIDQQVIHNRAPERREAYDKLKASLHRQAAV